MKIIKKINKLSSVLILAAAFGASSVAQAAHVQPSETEVELDNTAAVVNNSIITENELNAMTDNILATYRSHGANVDELTARKQAIQTLITRSIILQMARQSGMDITDMQLDATLEQTALRTNSSVDKILSVYGPVPKAVAREKFKEDFIINDVRRSSVRQRIHISEAEVTSMAKAIRDRGGHEPQYHLYQIVIPLSSSPTEQEYQRVQYESKKALAAARNGENMEEIAAAYSNGSMESDLGYIPESAVPLPFLPAIVAAKPGDVIGPFRSSIGMHILKVADVSDNAVTPIKTYNSAHILLKTSIIFSDEKAVAKLKSLKEDILNGRISFDEAAKAYSEDPGSAVNGGDLGYSTPDSYDPGFARGLVSLKPGQISDPVKSNFGWHLIFLKDVKVDRDSINAYKEKAHNIIFEREYSEAVASWERSLRETAYIHILDKKLLDAHVMLDQENAKVKQVATHDDRDSQTLSDNARYVN